MIMKCKDIEQTEITIPVNELLQAYRIITRIMKEHGYTHDTSFRRVQTWLSNAVCDNMKDGNILK